MSNWPQAAPFSNVSRVAAACLTIWILYVAQDLIIPTTIAALISFVLTPVIRKLKAIGVPAPLGSAIVTTFLGLIAIGLVVLASTQLLDLSQKLPQYKENLVQRIRSVKSSTGHSLTNLQATVDTIQHELSTTTAPVDKPAVSPVPVQVIQQEDDWFTTTSNYLSPALKPLTQCAVILMLTFFILMSLDLIVNKSQRFARRFDLYHASEAMDAASDILGRYLRTQLLLNMCYGLTISIVMMCFGLPNYLMWGILTGLLRYLPYVGPTFAVAMPTLLSIAISPNWTQPLAFLGCLLVIELIVNVFLEPLFYGHSTGVSSLGVIISTLFWGWLWGPAGLLLAMPITACLVVLGKHLRPLEALADLLGVEEPEKPVLSPETVETKTTPIGVVKLETNPS